MSVLLGDVGKTEGKDVKKLPCIEEGCVRCCTDSGNPLELTTGDILRLCRALSIGSDDFYAQYCGIMWNRIPGTCLFIPSVGLIFPCRFLEGGRCAVYDVRPIHCHLFPEGLVVNNSNMDIYRNCGYRCIDKGIKPAMTNKPYIHRLKDIDNRELKATASYFENFNYCVEMKEEEFKEIESLLTNVDYMEKAAKERDMCTEIINRKDKGRAESIFMRKLALLSMSKSFGVFA
ncbi:MAG: hypothetical protein C4550_04900 [Nitrospiraceae bacterium]|nr:MAG: hypothetical protein C4550_04900 [Nitrospiraceae bacterium]